MNTDLADKFGNLVSRVLGFVAGRYAGQVPSGGEDTQAETDLHALVNATLAELDAAHRRSEVRRAADRVRALWDIANAYVANEAPWTVAKTDPERAALVTRTALGLVRLSAVVAEPFVPQTARKVLELFGEKNDPAWPFNAREALRIDHTTTFARPEPLFAKIPAEWALTQRERFSGTV